MYTVVLMAALTSGHDTPDFLFRCRGGRGGRSSCHCSGYYGGGYGCHCGGYGGYGGGGGYGRGYGGAYGYGCLGCYGCHGYMTGYGHGYGTYGYTGAYACYGGWTCYGCAGATPGYAPGYAPYQPMPKAPVAAPQYYEQTGVQARVTMQVPPDARVFVDGMPTRATSEHRVFTTPPLEPGRTYYYEVRVEVVRDGRTLSETQQLVVRPGETASASFASLGNPNPAVQTAQGR